MAIQTIRIKDSQRREKASINYLARDYHQIKEELVARIPEILPEWTDRSEADLGMAMIELFAHMGDVLSYYQDRIAAESFLETARDRSSIVNHLRLIGYELGAAQPAMVELALLFHEEETGAVTINPGDRFVTGEAPQLSYEFLGDKALSLSLDKAAKIFTTVQDKLLFYANGVAGQEFHLNDPFIVLSEDCDFELRVDGVVWQEVSSWQATTAEDTHYQVLPLADQTAKILFSTDGAVPKQGAKVTASYVQDPGLKQTQVFMVTQGESHEEELGLGDGEPALSFKLKRTGVIPASVKIFIDGVEWENVKTLALSEYDHSHFLVELDPEEQPTATVYFGDGNHGRIPSLGAKVTTSYRTCAGKKGNVGSGRKWKVEKAKDERVKSRSAKTIVQQSGGSGGADRESLEEAALYGPTAYRSLDRAVTEEDYRVLLQSRWRGCKARARHEAHNRVAIHFAPSGSSEAPSADEMSAYERQINTYLYDKRMLGVDIRVYPALYIPVHLAVHLEVDSRYYRADVKQAAYEAVSELVDFDNLDFSSRLYLSKVYEVIEAVEGVDSVFVYLFGRSQSVIMQDGLTEDQLIQFNNTVDLVNDQTDSTTLRGILSKLLDIAGHIPENGFIKVIGHELMHQGNLKIFASGGR